jgi:hypothetical protein
VFPDVSLDPQCLQLPGRANQVLAQRQSVPSQKMRLCLHNRYENYRSGVSLSTSKARLLMMTGSRMAIREFEIPIILVTHMTKFN